LGVLVRLLSLGLFLLINFYTKGGFSNPICSQPIAVNKKFQNLLNARDTELGKFSNKKEIAAKADHTLSTLIAAKSKIIGNWMNKRVLGNATEADIVKQWRVYYAQNFVLGKYPNKDQKVNQLIKEFIENFYSQFLPKKEKGRIQAVFHKAKSLAIHKIKSFKIKADQKSQILSRVSAIKLYWMKKFESSKFKKQPLEVFSWGVAYDPAPNEINIGLEVLQYSSDETLFAVFAHEIGHSFDPCRWGAFFKGSFAFEKVITCLRGKNSVQAKKRDDSKMKKMVQAGKLSKELAMALKLNPTCNKIQYPPIGVQSDQAPESFADWFSAEVTSEYKYLSGNTRTDLCASKKLRVGSSYPTNNFRLERIFLSHPKIRKTLKFKGEGQYCSL